MYVYFVAIVLDLVDNRTGGQSSLQRDALRYRRNVPKGLLWKKKKERAGPF